MMMKMKKMIMMEMIGGNKAMVILGTGRVQNSHGKGRTYKHHLM